MSSEADLGPYQAPPTVAVADLEIVIPVYNEEHSITACIEALVEHTADGFPLSTRITIADNASTDGTWEVASALAQRFPQVSAIHLARKGRGRALRAAWSQSSATVVAYMDVDLSTDLSALLPLVAPLMSGHSDLAIGSRLASGSRVQRGAKRELISRCYNGILRMFLGIHFTDAQCGFKAVRRDVSVELIPLIQDEEWFFDTELLVLAERNGLRIAEVPVDWVDDPDSRVHVTSTALDDLAGVARLIRSFSVGKGLIRPNALIVTRPAPSLSTQLLPFAAVGLVTTAIFMGSFWLLAGVLGLLIADVVSLAVATVINLIANRRLTFAHRGQRGLVRHCSLGMLVATIPLSLNLIGLGIATLIAPGSIPVALVLVTVANLIATGIRFTLLRSWVFEAS
jgi:putative flippase GtrA